MPKKVIVVDGANVAYEEPSQAGKPKVSNLTAMQEALEQEGYDPIVIVDASLFHEVDDPDQLDALIDKGKIHQVPAGTEADYFILEKAQEAEAQVVSNDQFEKYQDRYPWIRERRVPYMIINGQVQLYEPKLEE